MINLLELFSNLESVISSDKIADLFGQCEQTSLKSNVHTTVRCV